MLTLPDFSWFFNKQGSYVTTNTYTGTLGTDPKSGCVNRTTFVYKIYAVNNDGVPSAVCAECSWNTPWNQGSKELCRFEEEFSGSAEGLAAASAWVEEKYASTNPNL